MPREKRRPCPVAAALAGACLCLGAASTRGDDWPQWLGPRRDGIWRESGLVDKLPAAGPKVLWRTALGTGYSGPAVAGDRVYVMDRQRAKDAAGKPLPAAAGKISGKDRVLCLNAGTGKVLWTHEYDSIYKVSYPSGPRVTPLIRDRRVYTLGTMGELFCMDAATGGVHWSKNLAKDYHAPVPVWGWSANLVCEGDLLYCLVGGPGSAVVAFHKDTGKEVWRALTSKEICYSPPILEQAGGKRQLIVWLSDSINGLDPATGKLYWTLKYPVSDKGPAVNISTMRREGDLLFLSSAYEGPTVLQLAADKPDAKILWTSSEKEAEKNPVLNCLMCTPLVRHGFAYGIDFGGALRCVDIHTGKQSWETYAPVTGKMTDCGSAFLMQVGDSDRAVLFNDQGELILADLTPQAYTEHGRARILEPVQDARKRHVVWTCPACAHRCIFARNEKEIVCVSLAANQG